VQTAIKNELQGLKLRDWMEDIRKNLTIVHTDERYFKSTMPRELWPGGAKLEMSVEDGEPPSKPNPGPSGLGSRPSPRSSSPAPHPK
jgi:hypothetical protein